MDHKKKNEEIRREQIWILLSQFNNKKRVRTTGTNLERNISNPGEKFTEFRPERTGNIPKEHEGYNLQEKNQGKEWKRILLHQKITYSESLINT